MKNDICPGSKVGCWTITGEYINTTRGEKKWKCHCDCGTTRYVLERSLRHGGSFSCGCIRKEKLKKAIMHEIAGQIFGNLTALYIAENQPKKSGIYWTCSCSCGNQCNVLASLLVRGRKTHCGCKTQKDYYFIDITGKRFERLVALYPTQERTKKGGIIWHCRCDCGNEVDASYNELKYANMKSCGCRKKEHDEKLKDYLVLVGGTSLDAIKSKKIPTNNTTGVKGVYLIRGKWVAKIVFQKKAYYLGTYTEFKDAVKARREAEEIINSGTIAYYTRWKKKADADPTWGKEHPRDRGREVCERRN